MHHQNSLQVVLDEDLRELLQAIGELEFVERGERFCKMCHTLLSVKNLQIIIPLEGGSFEFVCDKPECVQKSEPLVL